jgi:hypothetical protein
VAARRQSGFKCSGTLEKEGMECIHAQNVIKFNFGGRETNKTTTEQAAQNELALIFWLFAF